MNNFFDYYLGFGAFLGIAIIPFYVILYLVKKIIKCYFKIGECD